MSALSHILASPIDKAENTTDAATPMPLLKKEDKNGEQTADTPKADAAPGEEHTSPKEAVYTSTTTSTRRNASGTVSSVYSGNKMRHLKKEDGIPLWRKDIQYDFLRLVFFDKTRCFTKYSDGSKENTFAEIYIDAMAKSSKCSKILKEKLLQDHEGAICMAMVCLLVNVGRMNTTLNFFPEMRAQLRTYHSIPALQAHQDPNAYKQLQDAPRLKSILKGATEDVPQPGTIEDIKAASIPRTNPVNLIFVMSQYAPKISEVHFQARDFFELVTKPSLSSASRAKAFLWLLWWYLESDFSVEDAKRNPFGPGQVGDGEGSDAPPFKVPTLDTLTEEQQAAENMDTEEEKKYGEVKRKERIAILASEPSPAMTALKRARKEKGLVSGGRDGIHSDDDASEAGWSKGQTAGRRSSMLNHETGSDYTRSPSPVASRGFNAVNSTGGDMRINNLLNNDDGSEMSPPRAGLAPVSGQKKGPGRGNWRRQRTKQENGMSTTRLQDDRSHHVPLLPNTNQLSFVNEAPLMQTTTSGSYHRASSASYTQNPSEHIPTPSYQAQKRHRGVTQHQSAIINHRKQQIDYTLDRRIRKTHIRARDRREAEGSILRAWKRVRLMAVDYDSEEEQIRIRKAKDRAEKDEDWRALHRNKENQDAHDDVEPWRRPRILMAGFVRAPKEPNDVGEEAKSFAKAFRQCGRRLERWQESLAPGDVVTRRLRLQAEGRYDSHRRRHSAKEPSVNDDEPELVQDGRTGSSRQRAAPSRRSRNNIKMEESRGEQKMHTYLDEDDDGVELDDEDRELLGEVDADETEDDDEDEDMGED